MRQNVDWVEQKMKEIQINLIGKRTQSHGHWTLGRRIEGERKNWANVISRQTKNERSVRLWAESTF